jgi:hypothetical protein
MCDGYIYLSVNCTKIIEAMEASGGWSNPPVKKILYCPGCIKARMLWLTAQHPSFAIFVTAHHFEKVDKCPLSWVRDEEWFAQMCGYHVAHPEEVILPKRKEDAEEPFTENKRPRCDDDDE